MHELNVTFRGELVHLLIESIRFFDLLLGFAAAPLISLVTAVRILFGDVYIRIIIRIFLILYIILVSRLLELLKLLHQSGHGLLVIPDLGISCILQGLIE